MTVPYQRSKVSTGIGSLDHVDICVLFDTADVEDARYTGERGSLTDKENRKGQED